MWCARERSWGWSTRGSYREAEQPDRNEQGGGANVCAALVCYQFRLAAVEYVADGQDPAVASRVVQGDRLGAWIDDHDQSRWVSEIWR